MLGQGGLGPAQIPWIQGVAWGRSDWKREQPPSLSAASPWIGGSWARRRLGLSSMWDLWGQIPVPKRPGPLPCRSRASPPLPPKTSRHSRMEELPKCVFFTPDCVLQSALFPAGNSHLSELWLLLFLPSFSLEAPSSLLGAGIGAELLIPGRISRNSQWDVSS